MFEAFLLYDLKLMLFVILAVIKSSALWCAVGLLHLLLSSSVSLCRRSLPMGRILRNARCN